VAQRREVIAAFDLDSRTYGVDGRIAALPARDVERVHLAVAPAEKRRGGGLIRFYPDGSSSGGEIDLAFRGESATVNVDWLTGRVATR
jgi:general secretion pathway protein H